MRRHVGSIDFRSAPCRGAPDARLLTALLAVTNFLVVFDGLVVTVALPVVQREFGLSQAGAQWVLTAYTAQLGGMPLFGGRCGDRFGRRAVLTAGLMLFGAGLLVAGIAPTAGALLTGRVLQGVGAAFAVPTSFAVISGHPSPGHRDRMFAAVAVAGGGIGAVGGAVIGGVVTQGLGWRYVFLLSVPVALAAIAAAPGLLPARTATASPRQLDLPGAVLSVTGLSLLVFAISYSAASGPRTPLTSTVLALSAAALTVLIRRERRAAAPLFRPETLRIRSYRTSLAAMPANEFAYQGCVFIGLLLGSGPAGVRDIGQRVPAAQLPSMVLIGLGTIATARTGPADSAHPAATVVGYQTALLVAAGVALLGGLIVTCLKAAPDGHVPSRKGTTTGRGPSRRKNT